MQQEMAPICNAVQWNSQTSASKRALPSTGSFDDIGAGARFRRLSEFQKRTQHGPATFRRLALVPDARSFVASEWLGKKRSKLRRRNGARKEKALSLDAAFGAKPIELLFGLDALRHARHAQIIAELNDRAAKRSRALLIGDVRDERTVDFDFVERKALQVAQRREARAEVVDCEADAEFFAAAPA